MGPLFFNPVICHSKYLSKDKHFIHPHPSPITAFLFFLPLMKHLQSIFIHDCQLLFPHPPHIVEVNPGHFRNV